MWTSEALGLPGTHQANTICPPVDVSAALQNFVNVFIKHWFFYITHFCLGFILIGRGGNRRTRITYVITTTSPDFE